jgi:hypothetical protein
MQRDALGQQLRPGRAMDRSVDAASAAQARVGRVDDGIDRFARQIALRASDALPALRARHRAR